MIKYTVVVPLFNSSSYCLFALNSLANQTYSNLELILINDGSTDDTESVVYQFINEHHEVDIKYKKIQNSGPSTARNIGIDLASGDYICFLDSDDAYDIHLFEELNSIINQEVDICYFGWVERTLDGKDFSRYDDCFKYVDNITGKEAAVKKFNRELWMCNCNEVYSLKMLRLHDIHYLEGIFSGEDTNFIYKALLNATNVRCLPKNYFINTYRKDSLMHHTFSTRYLTEFKSLEELCSYSKSFSNGYYYSMFYTLYYYSRITVAKKIVKSLVGLKGFAFSKMVKQYIPALSKIDGMLLNKKEKIECRIYGFSKVMFYYFVKMYYNLIKRSER